MLGVLRREWAPDAFVVSFKLETDDHILIEKVPTASRLVPPILLIRQKSFMQ
jgi:hypothetical protein